MEITYTHIHAQINNKHVHTYPMVSQMNSQLQRAPTRFWLNFLYRVNQVTISHQCKLEHFVVRLKSYKTTYPHNW